MAEAIFAEQVRAAGLQDQFEIRSAGLASYHIGERPHRGTIQVLARHQIPLDPQKTAQQVIPRSVAEYDYVIAMDSGHYKVLQGNGNVHLMLDYTTKTADQDVPDPYYTLDFDEVYNLLEDASRGLLAVICKEHQI